MRLFTVLPVIFLSLLAVSQQAGRDAVSQEKSSAQHLKLRGCIRGDSSSTFIQDGTGATFHLQGKERQVDSNRGKFVELFVKEIPPAAGSGPNALPILQVAQLKQISPGCPAAGNIPVTKTNSSPAVGSSGNTPPTRPSPGSSTNPNTSGENGAPSDGTGNPPPRP